MPLFSIVYEKRGGYELRKRFPPAFRAPYCYQTLWIIFFNGLQQLLNHLFNFGRLEIWRKLSIFGKKQAPNKESWSLFYPNKWRAIFPGFPRKSHRSFDGDYPHRPHPCGAENLPGVYHKWNPPTGVKTPGPPLCLESPWGPLLLLNNPGGHLSLLPWK